MRVQLPNDLVEKVRDWAEDLVDHFRKDREHPHTMPWTRDLMTDDELRQWRASRKEAARLIDTETCEIVCWYANANGDPYGIGAMLGEEDHLDKGYADKFNWVRSPESNGWICEGDLPKEKISALYERIERERRKSMS